MALSSRCDLESEQRTTTTRHYYRKTTPSITLLPVANLNKCCMADSIVRKLIKNEKHNHWNWWVSKINELREKCCNILPLSRPSYMSSKSCLTDVLEWQMEEKPLWVKPYRTFCLTAALFLKTTSSRYTDPTHFIRKLFLSMSLAYKT